jgi:hypothetical protein
MIDICFPYCVSQYSSLFLNSLDCINGYINNETKVYKLVLSVKNGNNEFIILTDTLSLNETSDVQFEVREKYFEMIDMCYPNVFIFYISIN